MPRAALYTVADVARILQVNPKSVYRLHRQGRLPASYKLGSSRTSALRWEPTEVENFLRRNAVKP
jgi:predicted DNA-binding transcriptional regulator AlpA